MKSFKVRKIALPAILLMLLISHVVYGQPRSGDAYYNYGEAMQKAITFYKANRSGDLPDDYQLIWRGDSGMQDGADVGLDLTGGWYDAGDHVKFNLPMAYSAGQLGWAIYEYKEAFIQTGLLDTLLDEIKWTTDYLIKCHPEPDIYYYQVGTGESDHNVWNPPEIVHLTTDRPALKVDPSTPGSDAAGQAAAALAIASIIFTESDPFYAEECLETAKSLFEFANTYRGFYPLGAFYPSGSYLDDICWAAVWLYEKTGDSYYLDAALSVLEPGKLGGHHTHCWDDVSYGAAIMLARFTGDSAYVEVVETNLDGWMPGGIAYTPGGLAYLDSWGVLRYASAAAFLAFLWADLPIGDPAKKAQYHQFAEEQMNYILGDNPRGGSYVVGFGENPPLHPHHRTAHGSWCSMLEVPDYHRHTLYGALVGGPDTSDEHNDDIKDYTLNEVATDYNAAFVGSLAKMHTMYGGAVIPGFPRKEDFRPGEERINAYFARGWADFEGPVSSNFLIQVNNRDAWPATLKDSLSARYFFNLSEYTAAGAPLSGINIQLEADEGATLSELLHWSGDYYCVVADFTGTLIYPGEWNLCEKDAKFSVSFDSAIWDSDNDWSYRNIEKNPDYDTSSFLAMTPYIPVYEDGILLWGEEPPRTGDTTPPGIPSGLTGEAPDSASINLSWNINDDLDIKHYLIYRGTTPNFTINPGSPAGEAIVLDYSDKGLAAGTAYYYRITAVDTSGNMSAASAVLEVSTGPAPAAPVTVQAETISAKRIDLSWKENTETRVKAYRIYRGSSAGFIPGETTLIGKSRKADYSDVGLTPSTTYYYRITAEDRSGSESAPSTEVSAITLPPDTTAPAAPTGINGEVLSTSMIDLDWDDNTEADLIFYNVYRSKVSGFIPSTATLAAPVTASEYSDKELAGGTTYYYKITAVDSSDNESAAAFSLPLTTKARLQVEYLNADNLDEGEWIKPYIRILSNSALTIPLEDVTVRYWYTREDTSPGDQAYTLYTAQIENPWGGNLSGGVTASFHDSPPAPGADTYMEFSFNTGAGALTGTGQYVMVQGALSSGSFNTAFDETNDHSYKPVTADYVTSDTITVYINGQLIWGDEPGETAPQVITGDVNDSGQVDIVDALMTAQYYVGLNPPGFNPAAGDVNRDGSITIVDALIIARYYVGLRPEL